MRVTMRIGIMPVRLRLILKTMEADLAIMRVVQAIFIQERMEKVVLHPVQPFSVSVPPVLITSRNNHELGILGECVCMEKPRHLHGICTPDGHFLGAFSSFSLPGSRENVEKTRA